LQQCALDSEAGDGAAGDGAADADREQLERLFLSLA